MTSPHDYPAAVELGIPDPGDEPDELHERGCWHYDFTAFCVTCDPASYGPCAPECPYEHTCCGCPAACDLHDDEDEEDR